MAERPCALAIARAQNMFWAWNSAPDSSRGRRPRALFRQNFKKVTRLRSDRAGPVASLLTYSYHRAKYICPCHQVHDGKNWNAIPYCNNPESRRWRQTNIDTLPFSLEISLSLTERSNHKSGPRAVDLLLPASFLEYQ